MSKQNNNENNVQQPQGDYENLLEMLDAESGTTISGRVYRITSPAEQASGKLNLYARLTNLLTTTG